MKKYFRFLGVALLATTLCLAMVSCGDKNEDEGTEQGNNNGNNNGNNGNDQGGNGNVTVALGSVANYSTPQDSLVAYTGQGNACVVASQRSAHWSSSTQYSMYFPFVKVVVPAVVGQYDTSSAVITYSTGDFYRTGNAQLQEFPDWILKGNMSANVTAFNSSSLTISATASGLMYNQYQGFYDYSQAVQSGTIEASDEALAQYMANAPTANMNVTITNVILKNMDAKAFVKGTARF